MRKVPIAIRIRTARRTAIETVMKPAVAGKTEKDADLDRRRHDQRIATLGVSLLLALVLCLPDVARAQPADPHALFEEKCGRCHGHAGTFAREQLTIEEGDVVGRRTGKAVLETLARHFGQLTDAEAHLIEDMFRRQIAAGGLYAQKCRVCHDPAKDLARQTLIFSNRSLIGRYSGRSIEEFLGYHGRLSSDEQRTMLGLLTWHLTTGGATAD